MGIRRLARGHPAHDLSWDFEPATHRPLRLLCSLNLWSGRTTVTVPTRPRFLCCGQQKQVDVSFQSSQMLHILSCFISQQNWRQQLCSKALSNKHSTESYSWKIIFYRCSRLDHCCLVNRQEYISHFTDQKHNNKQSVGHPLPRRCHSEQY